MDLHESLEELLVHVKWDDKLAKAIYLFRVQYVTRSREHMEFFGGNLLGVNVVNFKDSDRNKFLSLFDIDYDELKVAIKRATNIVHKYLVAGDPLNLLMMYGIHRFTVERNISEKARKQGKYELASVFFQRCFAILISDYFHYSADPKIVQAAYSNLSKKFLIKELGSWNKVVDYRALALIDKTSPHTKTFERFDDGNKIQYAISDSQGRVKSLILGYYSEIETVRHTGGSISVHSSTSTDEEGEEVLTVKARSVEGHVFYLRQLISDPQTFVVEELLRVVGKSNTNTSVRAVRSVLVWMAENYATPQHHKLVDEFISKTVVQAVHFLNTNIDHTKHKDLPYVLTQLKNLFLSTRSVDPDLLELREIGEKIVVLSQGKLSNSLMMATRTAVIIYICLRFLATNK